ncbi:MAG: anti-sigma regulatory factor [Nodosilinea sp. LVE1205-7]
MVATSRLATDQGWGSLSFVSTLYLHPVLEILLAEVPKPWQAEVRLGLQEALVNAAKHGNCLDPSKQVTVRYTVLASRFYWVITDQGQGFDHPCNSRDCLDCNEFHIGECGRGLFILYKIFDQVDWHHGGREVHLHKIMDHPQNHLLLQLLRSG